MNEGEVPRYYVKNSHPAIIEPGAWDQVQKEMQRRKANPRQRYCNSPFSWKIICGDCGCAYGSKVWHSTDRYKRVIWQCNGKFKGEEKCRTPHLTEDRIKEAFQEAVSALITDRETLLEDGRLIKKSLCDLTGIDEKLRKVEQEMTVVAGLIDACVHENAMAAQDQGDYNSRYTELTERFEVLQVRQAALQNERSECERKDDVLSGFLFELSELDELSLEFSPRRWNAIVDHVTVHHDGRLVFSFQNGSEVSVMV